MDKPESVRENEMHKIPWEYIERETLREKMNLF